MGKPVDRHAHVGLDAVLAELRGQVDAVLALDVEVVERVDDVEAGAVDDDVGLVLDAVGVDDAVGDDLGDAVGAELDVVAQERRVVRVGLQHALAAEPVVGRQLGAQLGVGDRLGEVALHDLLGERQDVEVAVEARWRGPRAPSRGRCGTPAARRAPWRSSFLRHSGVGLSFLGSTHAGRALEDRQLADLLGDDRDELDRAGARADDDDLLALEVDAWSHCAEWNSGPANESAPCDLGDVGDVQAADAGDHDRAS